VKKNQKLCFVIMGYGKKTDLALGKTYDLDKTYKNIIKPAVIKAGFDCIRADEIKESGIIDRSMYGLLMRAELVIADITTYNPNAIYELGIRHAVRPYSTIVLKERNGDIPFDLDHTRMFKYTHLGEDIGVDEAQRCKDELIALIEEINKYQKTDSPLYEYIQDVEPPKLPDSEYEAIIEELAKQEKHIFAIVEEAKSCMIKDEFITASKLWEKAQKMVPNETYFIQQRALCTYKSKHPSEHTALIDALKIIGELKPDGQTTDPETLGITGAIYKQMWFLNNDVNFLDRAIEFYGKCYKISNDYYTGENYALCLNVKEKFVEDKEEKIYAKISAKKIREKILDNLTNLIDSEDFENRLDKKWIYATISHCYYGLGNSEKHQKYKKLFMSEDTCDWEMRTYEKNLKMLEKYI